MELGRAWKERKGKREADKCVDCVEKKDDTMINAVKYNGENTRLLVTVRRVRLHSSEGRRSGLGRI